MIRYKSLPTLGLVLVFFLLFSCGQSQNNTRFAVIKYQQETCTFCPGGDAGIEDWTTNGPYVPGDELVGEERTQYGGYVMAQHVRPSSSAF